MSSPRKSEDPSPKLQLSLTQLMASALAAVTATFAASYLGVAGTVIGAALASVVTVAGTAIYGHSLRRAQAAIPGTRPLSGIPGSRPASVDDRPSAGASATRPRRPVRWPQVALGAVAVFLLVAAVVTGVEKATGRPLDNLVRNEAGHGTTFLGGGHPVMPTHPAAPASSTPTAPAPSTPPPPSDSPTPSISPTPSESPTPSTSSTPSESPAPSSSQSSSSQPATGSSALPAR